MSQQSYSDASDCMFMTWAKKTFHLPEAHNHYYATSKIVWLTVNQVIADTSK
jgi:hypothetical protein